MNVEDISLLTAEQVIAFLVNNRVAILCSQCSCEHEFTDKNSMVRLTDTSGETRKAVRRN